MWSFQERTGVFSLTGREGACMRLHLFGIWGQDIKRWALYKEMSEGSGDRLPEFNLGPSTYHYVKLEQIHWFICLSSPNQQNENNNHSIQVQCSCLKNPRDGGAWWAVVYGVTQSLTRLKWLSSSSIQVTGLSWQLIYVKFFNTVWHMVMLQ